MIKNVGFFLADDYVGETVRRMFEDLKHLNSDDLDEKGRLFLADRTRVAMAFVIGDDYRLAVVQRGRIKFPKKEKHPFKKQYDTVAADRALIPINGTYKVGNSLDKAKIISCKWNLGLAVENNPVPSDDAESVVMPVHLITISSDDLNKLAFPGEIWTYDDLIETYDNSPELLTEKLKAFCRCLDR